MFSTFVFTLSVLASFVHGDQTCDLPSNVLKSDCGYTGITQSQCEAKGCCWKPVAETGAADEPWCFFSASDGLDSQFYELTSMAPSSASLGFQGTLRLRRDGPEGLYGPDIDSLALSVSFDTEDILRVKIDSSAGARWEVPQSLVKRPHYASLSQPAALGSLNYDFTYTTSPFSFTVSRKSDGQAIFSSLPRLVFKDQYLELSSSLDPAAALFGLGESARTTHALARNRTYALWAADIGAMSFDQNLYGSYPLLLRLAGGRASGALLMSSSGLDVRLSEDSVTYKSVGGLLDLYLFAGPSPAAVSRQLTEVTGRPALPPFWSLGFHNCKWGYESVAQIRQVVANYSAAAIPLDTQWSDIDYMQSYRDFTTDSVNFKTEDMKSLADDLHANGQQFVVIIDPGISLHAGYDAYEQGLKDDIFIKDINGGNYMGYVWPGATYFPDFTHPAAQNYWQEQIKNFISSVPVDGLWIDMNEVSNFINSDGSGQVCNCKGGVILNCVAQCFTVDPENSLDFPPYNIHSAQGILGAKTLAMSAKHYNNATVYNMHNLYGLSEQIATAQALREVRGKRSFVLSRSGFISSGVHTAKWTGDNEATWDNIRTSIVGIMDLALFGVPMAGADICGFNGNSNEELCARWIEVGAFYPFSRNHNTIGADSQELYIWESVAEASRKALGLRYRMLPYMYTLFAHAHFTGENVARALWYTFPDDSSALGRDAQFMLGPAVLLSPVVTQGATSVDAYFPQGLWFDLFTQSLAIDASSGGRVVSLETPLTSTNAHMYGGHIMPMQQGGLTSFASRQTSFTLLTALSVNGDAEGDLFWDDGEQIDLKEYISVRYFAKCSAKSGLFSARVVTNTFSESENFSVDSVVVMSGANVAVPTKVELIVHRNKQVKRLVLANEFVSVAKNTITFSSLGLSLGDSFTLTWV